MLPIRIKIDVATMLLPIFGPPTPTLPLQEISCTPGEDLPANFKNIIPQYTN
jgi:hypothetical protein